MIYRGKTFVNAERHGVPDHLWIVVSDLDQDPNRALIANITSKRRNADDDCCVFQPGEHRFVTKVSYVRYDKTKIVLPDHLIRLENAGLLYPYPNMSDECLHRIVDGFAISEQVHYEYVELLCEQGFLPPETLDNFC